jgi:hypothetical protein
MNSRDRVRAALEFNSPDRPPRDQWTLPWAVTHYPEQVAKLSERFPSDFAGAPALYASQPFTSGDAYEVGDYIDEWGCVFENLQAGVIGEVKTPLIAAWSDLEKLRPPVELLDFDVEAVNAFCRGTEKFVFGGCCPRPFERLQFLRRSDQLYLDLGEGSPEFFDLLGRVHNFYLDQMERWAKTEVDALNFMDDWGAQRSLLISPRMWRKIFKPLYKQYVEIAHAHGKYAFMHSDGYIADIYPDLIEIGVDAVNSQLFCMDIESLAQYRGKITFWGEIDRQHLLPFGSVDEVRAAVRRVRANLESRGGVIAQCEFGPGGKPENVWAVYETWEEPSA